MKRVFWCMWVLALLAVFSLGASAQSKKLPPPSVDNAPAGKVMPDNEPVDPDDAEEPELLGGSWSTNAIIPIVDGLSQSTSVAAADGRVFVIGGGLGPGPTSRTNQVWAYNPADDSWEQKASIPVNPGGSFFGSAGRHGNFIYMFGGVQQDGMVFTALNTTWIYDIENDSWSPGATILGGGRFGAAVAKVGDFFYVTGGSDLFSALTAHLRYDPAADTYTTLAPLPAGLARIHGAGIEPAAAAGGGGDAGRVHVFAGGFGGRNHFAYDIATNIWSARPLMPFGVTDPGVVSFGSEIWVLGGQPAPGRAQVYDAISNTWLQSVRLPGPADNTSAAATADGKVYVMGGFNGATSIRTNFSFLVGGATVEGQIGSAASGPEPIFNGRVRLTGPVDRTARSDSAGKYRKRLPAGTYDATGSAFGFTPQTMAGLELEDGVRVLNFNLNALPRFNVSGTITSALDGSAMPNVDVRVPNSPLAARSDADGNYTLRAPEGGHTLTAGTGRCVFQLNRPITVTADRTENFVLTPLTDEFGYTCSEPDMKWEPATTLLPLFGDDESVQVTLPFPFTFYGETYTVAHVSTNGFLNFLAPDATFANLCIPNSTAPNALVAPMWEDWLVEGTGLVFTATDGEEGDRRYRVEWRNVPAFLGAGVATFQAILGEAGNTVTFQYNRTDGLAGDGRGATIGVEDAKGSVGLGYSCNRVGSAVVGRTVKIFRP